ncbi:MAG: hypothetical protein K2F57_06135 [Candidatus Gastranaerophilales bacterium]|nr:hypothetical protein [Candidatus Gastranaerophilales bacterium]
MSVSINPSFSGTMLIPFSEMKKQGINSHQIMRDIGAETAKFTTPDKMQVTQDGILVNIDDNKEKEYQGIIAKYGINIKKVDTPITQNNNADIDTYSFMVNKLTPEEAQAKIDNYTKLEEPEKSKEYLKVYEEFKNSPYSVENIDK